MSAKHEKQQEAARKAALATLYMKPVDSWSDEAKAMHKAQREAQGITGDWMKRDAAKGAFSVAATPIGAARKILADHPDLFPKLLDGMTLKEAAGQANGGEGGQTQTKAAAEGEPDGKGCGVQTQAKPKPAPEPPKADQAPDGKDAERLANMERHPYSAWALDMSADDMADLREEVRSGGLREKDIAVFQDEVVDGWQRLEACRAEDCLPQLRIVEFTGSEAEALAFVISKQLRRKHLTPGQCAAMGYELSKNSKPGRPAKNSVDLGSFKQDEAAAICRTSVSSIQHFAILQDELPDLAKQVKSGDMVLDAAFHKVKPKSETREYYHLAASEPSAPETPIVSGGDAWPTIEGWQQDDLSPTADLDVYAAVLKRSRKIDQSVWRYSWGKVSLHNQRTGKAPDQPAGDKNKPPGGQSKAQGGKRGHVDKDDPTRDEGDTGSGNGNQGEGSEESGPSGDGSGAAQAPEAPTSEQASASPESPGSLVDALTQADLKAAQSDAPVLFVPTQALLMIAEGKIAELQSQLDAAPTDAPGSLDEAKQVDLKTTDEEIAQLKKDNRLLQNDLKKTKDDLHKCMDHYRRAMDTVEGADIVKKVGWQNAAEKYGKAARHRRGRNARIDHLRKAMHRAKKVSDASHVSILEDALAKDEAAKNNLWLGKELDPKTLLEKEEGDAADQS